MDIKANEIKHLEIDKIVANPKNANKHPPEQIQRLIKILEFQGFREPLIISNRSGFLICGHGRLEAAKQMGMKSLPVIYQDFENEAQEYAHLIADNEIARWATLNVDSLCEEMKNIQLPDLDFLGLKNIEFLDNKKEEEKEKKEADIPPYYLIIECQDELEMNDLNEELKIRELNSYSIDKVKHRKTLEKLTTKRE